MGCNTLLLVLNDHIQEIEIDASLGHKISSAISKSTVMNGRPVDIQCGRSINGMSVITCNHMDITTIVAVGGNNASVLHRVGFIDHHTDEDQLKLLKSWADAQGYCLHKKPRRKPASIRVTPPRSPRKK